MAFNYPVLGYRDLEAIRANMILCGDEAVFFDSSSGGRSHDVWAFGFDNPFYISAADHSELENSAADGDICYYSVLGGGITRIDNSSCGVALTKTPNVLVSGHTKPRCVQVATATGKFACNSEYWQIHNIQASPTLNSFGRHDCRLTLVSGTPVGNWIDDNGAQKPPQVSDIYNIPAGDLIKSAPPLSKAATAPGDPISYPMWISNLNASTGAISCLGRGPFAISVGGHGTLSDGTPYVNVDLLDSEWGHGSDIMHANANWDACPKAPCALRISKGDVDAMEAQEEVAFPSGATASILSVVRNAKGLDPTGSQKTSDGYIAEIVVDIALPNAQVSSDADIQIDSMAITGPSIYTPSGSCNDAHEGQCAFFHTGVRAFAGVSTAGTASSKLPQSNTHYYAAGYLDDGTDGLQLTNSFTFSHHYGYVVQDAPSANFTNRGGDENGQLDDLSENFFVINGTSPNPISEGGKGGQSGVGIVNNFYALTSDAAGMDATTSTPSGIAQGTGVTLTANLSNFPSDLGTNTLYGKGTASICLYDSGNSKCTSPFEYVTYEITTTGSSGVLTITSRGDYFSTPIVGSGAVRIIPVAVSRPKYCTSISGSVAPVTNIGLNSFENVGGCLQLTNFLNASDSDTAKNAFVGANATDTHISNAKLNGILFLYENAEAYGTMSGCGDSFDVVPGWFCNPLLPPAAAITTNTFLDASAELWPCNTATGNVTVTVPAGSSYPNRTFEVKKTASANTCTVAMTTGDTLDGASSYSLSTNNQAVRFTNSGGTTKWYVTATVP